MWRGGGSICIDTARSSPTRRTTSPSAHSSLWTSSFPGVPAGDPPRPRRRLRCARSSGTNAAGGRMRFLFAIVLLASAAQAQSLNARGVARVNADIASVWSHDGASLAQAAAQAEAQKLVGLTKSITSKLAFTIVGVNHVTLSLPGAPGLRRFDATGVDAALPLAGTWSADVELRIHLKGKVLFIGIDDTFNVTVKVRNLSAQMSASIDSSDPAAPKLVSAQPPQIHFNISISSSNTLVSFLGLLASGLVDGPGKAVVAAAADYVAAKLDLFAQSNPSVMNSGGPALAPIRRGALDGAAAALRGEGAAD